MSGLEFFEIKYVFSFYLSLRLYAELEGKLIDRFPMSLRKTYKVVQHKCKGWGLQTFLNSIPMLDKQIGLEKKGRNDLDTIWVKNRQY